MNDYNQQHNKAEQDGYYKDLKTRVNNLEIDMHKSFDLIRKMIARADELEKQLQANGD